MTGISSEFVKKGAERREKQVFIMVSKEERGMRNTENISQVMTMVLVFLVCWGPYAVLSIIGVLGFDKVFITHLYRR